jgi:hypothetical protein
LEYVRAQRLDGSTLCGVLYPSREARVADVGMFVFESQQGQPTWVPWVEVRPLHPERTGPWRYFDRLKAEVAPPPSLHEVISTYTGGVGPHVRLRVMYPRGNGNKPVELIACELEGREADLQLLVAALSDFVAFRPRRDGERSVFFNLPEFGIATALVVHRRANLQLIMARLAWEGLTVHCVDTKAARVVAFMPDKMSRSIHMWGDQYKVDPVTAGPVRDAWRYRLSHLPPHWPDVYTMDGVAHYVALDNEGAAARLGSEAASAAAAANPVLQWYMQRDASRKSNPAAIPHQLPRGTTLTEPQMLQLMNCVYCIDYAPFDEEHKQRLRDIVFVYTLFGHTGRIAGSYERSDRFRGCGEALRVYRGETKETRSLPTEALNRICRADDGSLNPDWKGTGGRGYKGIYAPLPNQAVYRPSFTRKPKKSDISATRVSLSLTMGVA